MTSNSELRKIIKPIAFMKMADSLSKLSYDPKHKVGSLIIKNDWTEINSMGYNGNYQGAPNKRDSLESGKSNFIHAEMNALILSTLNREEASKYTLFVTMTPCETCSRLIVNKGIKKVIALKEYPNCGDSLTVFKNSNVEFIYLKDLIHDLYKNTELYKNSYSVVENSIDDVNLDLVLYHLLNSQLKTFFETIDYGAITKSVSVEIFSDIVAFKNVKIIHKKYVEVVVDKLYDLYI
jgi:dCMP deaminase